MYKLKHTHAHTDPPQFIPLFFDNYWTLADFQDSGANRARYFQLNPHSDIHTYMFIHTYRQTDMSVCTHILTHAWTLTCQHTNIEVRS